MIFDLLSPPQGPRGGAKKCAVAHPIHVSIPHTKFGWISSNGLGGDSLTDGRTDGRRRLQYLRRFLAHLSRRLMGELIEYQSLRRPSVRPSSVRPSTFSNIFFSETIGPIKLKFHMETP